MGVGGARADICTHLDLFSLLGAGSKPFDIVGGHVKSESARGPGPRFRSSKGAGQIRADFWARAPGSVESRRPCAPPWMWNVACEPASGCW